MSQLASYTLIPGNDFALLAAYQGDAVGFGFHVVPEFIILRWHLVVMVYLLPLHWQG